MNSFGSVVLVSLSGGNEAQKTPDAAAWLSILALKVRKHQFLPCTVIFCLSFVTLLYSLTSFFSRFILPLVFLNFWSSLIFLFFLPSSSSSSSSLSFFFYFFLNVLTHTLLLHFTSLSSLLFSCSSPYISLFKTFIQLFFLYLPFLFSSFLLFILRLFPC